MWNSTIDTSAMWGVNSYQRAFERWQKAPQWRGDKKTDFEPRKFDANSSRRNYSLRMRKDDGAIACRYHSPDVVTFLPDGKIELHPRSSKTTDMFANALLPAGLRTDFNNAKGTLVSCGEGYRWQHERIYDVGGCTSITFEQHTWADAGWYPVDPDDTNAIEVPRVVRKLARAATKKHGLKRFEQWANTAVMMRLGQQVEWDHFGGDHSTLVGSLDDRSRWIDLIKLRRFWPDADERRVCFGRPVHSYFNRLTRTYDRVEPLTPAEQAQRFVKRLVAALRVAIYTVERCVDVETIPYYESWDQVADVAKRASLYSEAIRNAKYRKPMLMAAE